MSKFRVGDRVRYLSGRNLLPEGVVTDPAWKKHGQVYCHVKFDPAITRQGTGGYFEFDLELVEPAPTVEPTPPACCEALLNKGQIRKICAAHKVDVERYMVLDNGPRRVNLVGDYLHELSCREVK